MRRRTGSVALAAALVASTPVLLTAGLVWQEAAPPGGIAPEQGIRFNFKDVPFEQVLDYFARRSGLPIIHEAPVPVATMTFISAQAYSFDDALTILNLNLQAHDRRLRKETNFLYLATLADMARKPTRVVDPDDLARVPLDEIVTVTIPLDNALAEEVAEQIRPLVGPLGKVTAVPQQNMLIIVETGPQCLRISEIVRSIDAIRPIDSEFKLFPLKHAEAEVVVNALKGLVAKKIQRIITDKDGKQRTVEEIDIGGVTMQADARTNSVVVVGPRGRLNTVEELIALLDVPEGSGEDRQMMTFALGAITPDAAASQLQKLFASTPERRRPTVLPLTDAGKVTVIGRPGDVTQAALLLAELDPELGATADRVTRSIRIGGDDPSAVLDAASKLLSDRQRRLLRMAATLDGKGAIVSGPPVDVDLFEQIIAQIDSRGAGRFRVVDVDSADPEATVECARRIFLRRAAELPEGLADQVESEYDPPSGRIIVTGPELGVDLFIESLEQARQMTPPARTTRILDVRHAEAGEIVGPLREMLDTADSIDPTRQVAAPSIRVIERTNSLIVTAEPAQHTLIREFVARLDTLEQTDLPPLRLLQVRSADAVALAAMLNEQYRRRPQMDRSSRPVDVRADVSTNTLIVSAHADLFDEIKSFVDDINTGLDDGPERVTVLFQLKAARAEAVATAMNRLYPEPPIPLDRRGRPMPWLREPKEVTVSSDPSSNSLIIDAPADRISSLQELAAKLDRVELPPVADLRTYRIVGAELESIASTLNALARQGNLSSPAEPGKQPVQVMIETEPRSGTLIVAGDEVTFARVESLVHELSAAPEQRELRVLPLINADAGALALTIADVFADDRAAEPPVIRVDELSNALIVRATPGQLAEIERLAKSVDEAAQASSRHVRMIQVDRSRADAGLIAETIRRLLEQRGGVKVEVLRAEDLVDEDEPTSFLPPQRGLILPEFIVGVAIAQVAPEPAEDEDRPADVTIAVDPATNTLVVVGPSRLTERVAQLAAELEERMPPEPTKVRIVALTDTADARSVANIVNQTIGQVGYASDTNPSGFTSRVSIAPDPSGAAVIVWANDTDFETIGALIGSISKLNAVTSLTVKVYPLSNITGARAAVAINTMLNPSVRGRRSTQQRELDLSINDVSASFDPNLVRVTPTPSGTSLIVAAPAEAIELIDAFIGQIDKSPVTERLAIRRYQLENADAAALNRTLQALFDAQRQGPNAQDIPRARFVADARTNSLLVTASADQHEQVQRVIDASDMPQQDDDLVLAIIPLRQARPSTVQRVIQQAVIGGDPGRRERIQISADDRSNIFVVRAPAEEMAEIRRIIDEVDSSETAGLPVRSLKLERADAEVVARALKVFFSDRASASTAGGRRATSSVAITGDKQSGTLVIAASDEDFAQLQELVAMFDAPAEARELQFRIVQLRNARVSDLAETITGIGWELRTDRLQSGTMRTDDQRVFIRTNERTNSFILMGRGQQFDTIERIIRELDQDQADTSQRIVRVVPVPVGDLGALQRVIDRAMTRTDWRPWMGVDPDRVLVEIDTRRRILVLIGRADRVDQAEGYITQLAGAGMQQDALVVSIPLDHARADRAAQSLRRFYDQRARAEGGSPQAVSIVGSTEGNVILISGNERDVAMLRDLLDQIDQPELGDDRTINVYTLRNADAGETAQTLRQMFPRTSRADERVIVTPQQSTNSLIVSAPDSLYEQVQALLKQLDAPPSIDSANIVTVSLDSASAAEVARALREALPDTVKVQITPVARSNSLLLTGSDEAIAIVVAQIKTLDTAPVRSLQQFRRVELTHAMASDVSYTLRTILRERARAAGEPAPSVDYNTRTNTLLISATADQMAEVNEIVAQLDVAGDVDRTSEFVRLEYADAEQAASALEVFYGRYAPEAATPAARSVTIVPDPGSNSLVISAPQSEWQGITALLDKLDSSEYDTSRQIVVIALIHADATSVARALNEGFRAPISEQVRQAQIKQAQDRRNQGRGQNDYYPPPVIIDAAGAPTVSAEVQTNSLVVFAGRDDVERIRAIVRQLDVPDSMRLSNAKVIPLSNGRASQVAQALREIFINTDTRRAGPNALIIYGDDTSNSLIVRATDEEFAHVRALAEALQQEGDRSQLKTYIIRLTRVPAARLRPTLLATFLPQAQRLGETIAVEVDRGSNSLVIAASERMAAEIERVARELDGAPEDADENGEQGAGPVPIGLGQTITIVDVVHQDPVQIRTMLDQLGVTQPQPIDRPGLVAEPVRVVPLTTRRAVALVGAMADLAAVESLVRALDAEPAAAEQHIAIVQLKLADATALVATLDHMLGFDATSGRTAPARALIEHLRRLHLARNALDGEDLEFDLSVPIRLYADAQTNSVVVSSTKANIAAISDLIETLDTLPIGESVVVRIFPLENAAAARIKGILDDIFEKGDELRRAPGTGRFGTPTTATGLALGGEVVITIDERTNALIVAGREDSVALVEVLVSDLDDVKSTRWIEPRIVLLKHADAVELAQTLRRVLVQGIESTPEADALRRQIARLRAVRQGVDPTDPDAMVISDIFAPMTGLVIEPDEHQNALIIVGTPNNIAVVTELASMLDVEAAGASNRVRIFPLEHAGAERIASIVSEMFQQRGRAGLLRPEDVLVVATDVRTNALIVSTSPRSFAVLESLLQSLDGAESDYSVGLHVIRVPEADSRTLAPKIQRLMRDRIEASTRAGSITSPADAFTIEADAAGDLLIIAASDENLALVQELIDALTSDVMALESAEAIEVIVLDNLRADEMARTLNQVYVEPENKRRGEDEVRVVASERLNALLISGTADDIAEIRAIIDQFEQADSIAVQHMKRFELHAANALEVVNLLESVLSGRSVGRGSARQATTLRFFRDAVVGQVEEELGEPPTEAQIDEVIRSRVVLTPELRTNSVVVVAPPEMLDLIESIIDDLDSTDAGERQIAMFRLENADARAMAEVLRDLFNLTQQGNRFVLIPTRQTADGADDELDLLHTRLTPVPDQRQELSITIDARTNTLLVSGTEEYLELVAQVVDELDQIEATERERLVFHLQNAQAVDVEQTLSRYFEAEAQRIRRTLGPQQAESVVRRLEQEVTIVGHEKSNTMVVSASPRYIDTVEAIIEELDAAPPQVMIQVLLAEVTLDAGDEWGVDLSIGPIGGSGFGFGSLAAGAGVASAFGVPNVSIEANNFGLLVRALQEQGKLEVLSRPQITVKNNERAQIQVGQNIGIVVGVERLENGNTRSDVERIDTGIILEVTPTISADGFVQLKLRPEISRVSSEVTQISEDFVTPIIEQRIVDTTVTVADGQTIVIGGLIQTIEDVRETKIPILGDIPLLGYLFRSKQATNVKTELLVILTPHIIPGGGSNARDLARELTNRAIDETTDLAKLKSVLGTVENQYVPENIIGPMPPESWRTEPAPGTQKETEPTELEQETPDGLKVRRNDGTD